MVDYYILGLCSAISFFTGWCVHLFFDIYQTGKLMDEIGKGKRIE